MESRIQRIHVRALLAAGLCVFATVASAATKPEDLELDPLLVREEERREVKVDKIDSENFEIGAYGGVMNIEDFGSDTLVGVRAAYHLTEDFFVEAQYGQTTLGQTSFERLSGGAQLLTDEERDYQYYNVALGWNIFPGESFIFDRWAFKGGLYVVAGAGSSEFGGDNRFTITGGVGYRFTATDWLSFRVDARDHVFETDLLGEQETKHNFEFSGSLSIFF